MTLSEAEQRLIAQAQDVRQRRSSQYSGLLEGGAISALGLTAVLRAFYGHDLPELPLRVQFAWQLVHKVLRIANQKPKEDDFRDAYNYLMGAYEVWLQDEENLEKYGKTEEEEKEEEENYHLRISLLRMWLNDDGTLPGNEFRTSLPLHLIQKVLREERIAGNNHSIRWPPAEDPYKEGRYILTYQGYTPTPEEAEDEQDNGFASAMQLSSVLTAAQAENLKRDYERFARAFPSLKAHMIQLAKDSIPEDEICQHCKIGRVLSDGCCNACGRETEADKYGMTISICGRCAGALDDDNVCKECGAQNREKEETEPPKMPDQIPETPGHWSRRMDRFFAWLWTAIPGGSSMWSGLHTQEVFAIRDFLKASTGVNKTLATGGQRTRTTEWKVVKVTYPNGQVMEMTDAGVSLFDPEGQANDYSVGDRVMTIEGPGVIVNENAEVQVEGVGRFNKMIIVAKNQGLWLENISPAVVAGLMDGTVVKTAMDIDKAMEKIHLARTEFKRNIRYSTSFEGGKNYTTIKILSNKPCPTTQDKSSTPATQEAEPSESTGNTSST